MESMSRIEEAYPMSTKTDGTRDKGRMVRRRDFVSGLMTGIGAGALVSYTEVPAAAAAPAAQLAQAAPVAGKKPFAGATVRVVCDENALINVINSGSPKLKKFLDDTGITLTPVTIPYDSLLEKIMIDLTSKTGEYDIVSPDGAWAGQIMASGGVEPLGKFYEELKADSGYDFNDLIPSALSFCSLKGVPFGLPYWTHSNAWMLYRRDVFEAMKLEPPKTLEDVMAVAKALQGSKGPDGKVIKYGTAGAGMRGDYIVMEWMQRMLSACETNNGVGQNVLWDDKWKPTFNDANGIAIAEYYRDLLNRYGPPGPSAMTWAEVRPLMFAGEVAIIGMAWDGWVLRFTDPKNTPYAGKFVWAPCPLKAGCARGGVLGERPLYLNAHSKNKQAALAVMKWATSKEGDLAMAESVSPGVVRASTIQNPIFQQKYPMMARRLEAYKNVTPEPLIPEWAEIKEHLGIALSQILSKEKGAKEALDIAATQTDKIFRKSGYYK
jgi:multiple sugar transport system substrate-binding protein